MTHTFVASITIAALSTLGDFIWAMWLPEHRAVYGFAHGLLLFGAIGLVFGTLAGRPAPGALAGAAIGAAAAGGFYVLSPFLGFSAMFPVWFGAWMALGWMYARLSDSPVRATVVLARGALAATASGLAFYLIAGIWMPFGPQGWDYLVHFAAWTFAYFPGFAALLTVRGT